jgi:hypothetical protein
MADRAQPDVRVAEMMRRQWGLVTARQAERAGLSRDVVRGRVESGLLLRLGRGIFAAAGAPSTWEQRALAGCFAAGAGAVLSHRSAARAWRLDLPASSGVEVTVSPRHSGRAPLPGVTVHRSGTLRGSDRTAVGVLPVTTVARTLADLAPALERPILAKVVDDALCRRLLTPVGLRHFLDGSGARSPVLRSILAPWLEEAALDSAAEGLFRRAIEAAGLPAPRGRYPIVAPDGRRYYLDFAWRDPKVALEVDGYRWHSSPAAHAADSHRANVLTGLGWTILRATPKELERSPATILRAIARQLARG